MNAIKYYKGGSMKLESGRGFRPAIDTRTVTAEFIKPESGEPGFWCSNTGGTSHSAYETEQDAIQAACAYLARQGYTTDHDAAQREAERECNARTKAAEMGRGAFPEVKGKEGWTIAAARILMERGEF